MRIGLVGKPNVGKSTAFAALTESAVEIANYPFTTIDPNVGVTFLPAEANVPVKHCEQSESRMAAFHPLQTMTLVQAVCVNLEQVPALAFVVQYQ